MTALEQSLSTNGQDGVSSLITALQGTSTALSLADLSRPDTPLIYVSPAFTRLTGYEAHEIVGQNCRLLQGAERSQKVRQEIGAAVQAGRSCTVVLRNFKKSGELFWNELTLAPLLDDAGRPRYYLGIQQDVTALEQSREPRQEPDDAAESFRGKGSESAQDLARQMKSRAAAQVEGSYGLEGPQELIQDLQRLGINGGLGCVVVTVLSRLPFISQRYGRDASAHAFMMYGQAMANMLSTNDQLYVWNEWTMVAVIGTGEEQERREFELQRLTTVQRMISVETSSRSALVDLGPRATVLPWRRGNKVPQLLKEIETVAQEVVR